MKPTKSTVGCHHADVFAVIAEAIRSVSPKARDSAITANSLLLEELSLDSLDLVAVILRLQDEFQVEIDPDEIPEMREVGDLAAGLTRQLGVAA